MSAANPDLLAATGTPGYPWLEAGDEAMTKPLNPAKPSGPAGPAGPAGLTTGSCGDAGRARTVERFLLGVAWRVGLGVWLGARLGAGFGAGGGKP